MITLLVRLARWSGWLPKIGNDGQTDKERALHLASFEAGLAKPTHVHSYRPWEYPPIGNSGRWRYCQSCRHIDWELIDG